MFQVHTDKIDKEGVGILVIGNKKGADDKKPNKASKMTKQIVCFSQQTPCCARQVCRIGLDTHEIGIELVIRKGDST